MGRYTSDDNRSMQCNPNNERYYSSRGYCDDDDDGYEISSFDRSAFEKKEEIKNQERKEALDAASIDIFRKKVVFCNSDDYQSFLIWKSEYLFRDVLKEKESLKEFRFEDYKGLTTNFKSFKAFLENYLDYDSLKEEQIKLEEDIELLEENYRFYKDSKSFAEIMKLKQTKKMHSFNFLESILKTDKFINDSIKSKYIFFDSVCISDNYMIFKISRSNSMQGSYVGGYPVRWFFAVRSYDPCRSREPEVLYENFEDVFTCKKYLIDL